MQNPQKSRPWPVVFDELQRDIDNTSFPGPVGEVVSQRMWDRLLELEGILKRLQPRAEAFR